MIFTYLSGTLYKIWCFYLYWFWRYKALNIYHAVTHTRTDQIPKTTFLDSKLMNQVKTRHRKFWRKTVLPLRNDGQLLIVIKKCILQTLRTAKNKKYSKEYVLYARHKKERVQHYVCKFGEVPLHKWNCFTDYHTKKESQILHM